MSDTSTTTIKAGPPRCPVCNNLMNMWVKLDKKDDWRHDWMWVCPQFCNVTRFWDLEKANNSSISTKKGEENEDRC